MEIDPQAEQILEYWFAGTRRDASQIDGRMGFWFGNDASADRQIRERFGEAVAQASRGELDAWAEQPRGRLALIVLLDQFRRNLYRGQPQAFELDHQVLRLSLLGMEAGHDRPLEPVERAFFYMPMQHSESLKVQEFSVQCFKRLAAAVEPSMQATFASFAQFAELHRDIVLRFGRFPHRNAILGRRSTPAEEAYLADDAPDFGQG